MRTMAQKRAEYALKQVLEYNESIKKKVENEKEKLKKAKDKFKSFSAGAPSMILQNGFGQTLAFWAAKWKDEHKAMFNIVMNWLSLKDNDINNNFATKNEKTAFLEEISQMSQQQYLLAQEETLRLLEWVKRYANADLGGA
ncbi:MAG: type III-B CRISPR module-associated protein Cmr5 [Campylobacterota bacterium]|nr:type III-B CRISPR module-associated protein Cmr5 [Campylobacterota bacterium]